MHVYTHTNITYYMYVCSKLTLFHLSSKPVLHYFDLYNLFHLRIQWHQCILLLYTHKHTHSLTHTHTLTHYHVQPSKSLQLPPHCSLSPYEQWYTRWTQITA